MAVNAFTISRSTIKELIGDYVSDRTEITESGWIGDAASIITVNIRAYRTIRKTPVPVNGWLSWGRKG